MEEGLGPGAFKAGLRSAARRAHLPARLAELDPSQLRTAAQLGEHHHHPLS